jgi:hypothetical protein
MTISNWIKYDHGEAISLSPLACLREAASAKAGERGRPVRLATEVRGGHLEIGVYNLFGICLPAPSSVGTGAGWQVI